MSWLNVPPLKQGKPGWCLPACVAMVTAYLQQPLLQDDVARWLGTDDLVGTPSSRINRLSQQGFSITYESLALPEVLESWLSQHIPPIVFVLTAELSYWTVSTPHAVVLAGFSDDSAHLFDPAVDLAPLTIPRDELLLAWSPFDYTYATLSLP